MVITAAEIKMKVNSLVLTIKRLRKMKKNQKLFFALESVDYIIRRERAGIARGVLGKTPDPKPILTPAGGEERPLSTACDFGTIIERILTGEFGLAAGARRGPDTWGISYMKG